MSPPPNDMDEKDAIGAYFSSPYSSSRSSGSSDSNQASSSPSWAEAGRFPENRPGLLARLGGWLGMRGTQRRLMWLGLIVAAAFLIYSHGQDPLIPEVAVPPPSGDATFTDALWDPSTGAQHDDDSTQTTAENDTQLEDVVFGEVGLPFDDSLANLRKMDPTIPQPKGYSPFYGGNSNRDIDISSDPLPVDATLRERLEVWRHAPGGRGEIPDEVELGGFMQYNLEECGSIEHSYNTHMIQVGTVVWASFNRSSLHTERERLITYMENLNTMALVNTGSGRGIVMQAGNSDTLQRAIWSIQFMRLRGTKLPVKIYCFPEELPAEGDEVYATLKGLDAELVAAKDQKKDAGNKKSYHLKAIAIIDNPFSEVLYLDSDSIPTRDPEYMFDAPSYKRLGIFATPDYWKTTAGNPIWAIMGVKCRGEWEMETGQMFIDKARHLDVLWLIRFMLEHHDDTEGWPGYFKYSDGDKDIFRWAMLMLRKRWGVPGRWVSGGALPSDTQTGFCSHTMLQNDAWGEPLFVHYNLLKQIPSGVGRNFCWGRHKQLPLFNTFPASPATARLGEPVLPPNDILDRGLGDVDCDMLADADEYGVARAPAKEMVMRRAARERGVKVKYHGGATSALCIDFDYIDPRSEKRRKSEQAQVKAQEESEKTMIEQWEQDAAAAKQHDKAELPRPKLHKDTILPNWEQPYEVVAWSSDQHLANFENDVYDLGFQSFSSF